MRRKISYASAVLIALAGFAGVIPQAVSASARQPVQAVRLLTGGPQNSPAQPTWDPGANHKTLFVDEFNRSSLNTSVWEDVWFGGLGKTGYSQFNPAEIACDYSGNVSEGSDVLSLKLSNTGSSCNGHHHSWTGAVIDARPRYAHSGGDWEAHIKLPCNSSSQVEGWPAFWITSDGHGEIDAMERYSYLGAHIHHYVNGNEQSEDSPAISRNWCGWHYYGVSWDSNTHTVKFYWDSGLVWSGTLPDSTALWPALDYTIQNASIKPSGSATMQVDWFRVWS
jgi:hypothetical protein